MSQKTILIAAIVFAFMTTGALQAELQLVGNFDELAGIDKEGNLGGDSPDDQACTGVLGGIWDTEVERTGSIDLVEWDGSRCATMMGHSNGIEPRGIGFNGITNPIDDTETGIAFLRYNARFNNYVTRTFIGLITDTRDQTVDVNAPIDVNTCNDPMGVTAGIFFVGNDSGQLELLTIDRETVLKPDVSGQQWYNIWIVAHNVTDTFDLYMSEAEGPAGEPGLPTPADLIQAGLPFATPTTDPLVGMIIADTAGTSEADRTERIWVDEFWWDGDQGLEAPKEAKQPIPANSAVDVAPDTALTWKPSPLAATHNVYIGENAEDVALATLDDPRGVLVSSDQDDSSYVPEALLALGTTYYWRVDGVNDLDTYMGSVWEFEVEPVALDLAQAYITVSASSFVGEQSPQNTIDHSGLDVNGTHATDVNTMWLSDTDPAGAWIEYTFDRSYQMQGMRVWNYNASDESTHGLGMKDVVVSYSDGTDWKTVGGVNQLAQAPGLEGYQANTVIELNNVVASAIRIAASSNWGGSENKFGLSEVRFSVIPNAARLPQPESGRVDIDPTPEISLSWRPGRVVAHHVLYLSTDEQAVMDGTAQSMILNDAEYPALNLDVNAVYYWRVDEVNEAEVWPGEIWNFSTAESLPIDDFEDYTNEPPFLIFQSWADGLGVNGDDWVPPIPSVPANGTGALVGYDIWTWDSPHVGRDVMERQYSHSPAQCMPLAYQNGESPYVSEAVHTIDHTQDWTGNGVDSLGFWYRGGSSVDSFSYDSGAQTYSVIAAGGNIANAGGAADTFHFVYKPLTGDGEMVVKVESIDEVHAWSKAGIMIRDGLESSAKHAFLGLAPANYATFAWRREVSDGASTNDIPGVLLPYWLKLVRSGDRITAYRSADGSVWRLTSLATIFMSSNVYIGMAVSSHESRSDPLCEAIFSNVRTSGSVAAGEFTQSASVSVEPLNMPERLYAAISDTTGKRVEVELDATGTTRNAWTLGAVDLTSISGSIDITHIKEIAIGVGDGVVGSDGIVFIDDVCLLSTN
ncbi:DUF4457 domain-containing protein [Planctomycetota bacterium]